MNQDVEKKKVALKMALGFLFVTDDELKRIKAEIYADTNQSHEKIELWQEIFVELEQIRMDEVSM